MASNHKGFTIAHLNIRGLLNKIDQVRYLLAKHKFKILHISETFLTSNVDTNLVNIPGYYTIRRDRVGKIGGGLVTFIESSLSYVLLSDLNDILPETLNIKISPRHCRPFFTTAVYRPPNSPASWVSSFEKLVTSARQLTDDLVILGDFNINLETTQNKWCHSFQQLGLEQIINKSTRVQQNTTSLIDHIYITKSSTLSEAGVLEIGLSDHYLIFASRKLGLRHTPRHSHKISYLDWKNFSPSAFQRDLCTVNWQDVYLCHTVEDMLDMFLSKFKRVMATHLQCKSKHVKSPVLPPWLDEEVQSSMKLRDSLKRKLDWNAYKKQRNFTNNLIRRKKKQHIANLVSDSHQKQTKKLWQTLRNSCHANVTPRGDSSPLNDSTVANTLNTHFSNIGHKLNSNFSSHTSSHPTPESTTHVLSEIPPINIHQFILYFKDIGINKATGTDGLSVKVLRLALPLVVNILCDIINRAISENCFPTQWKSAVITPLYKGGDRENPSNYRPISVLPVLSKIFERHILKTLSEYLYTNNLISDSQSGFRSKHSCSTAMQHLYSQWIESQKSRHSLVLLFLDFRKAFDTVNHNLLIKKISSLGISGHLLSLLNSYLAGRTQCVKINSSLSTTLPVSCGVPQGSILAPTLFLIFINDLLSLPLHSKVHAYADDTTFYLSNPNPTRLRGLVADDIISIEHWCDSNLMTINESKSHFLVVNPQNHSFSFSLKNSILQERGSTKLLGFTVNNTLTWKDHISEISNKISTNLRLFYNIRHLIDFNTSKLFYYNYVHSYLTYGIHLYFPLTPVVLTNRLSTLQRRALRVVCRPYQNKQPKKTLSNTFVTSKTEVLPVPHLFTFFTCISAYGIKKGQCPSYLSKEFMLAIPQNHKPTRYQHKIPSSHHYNRLNHHLVSAFNSLPDNIRRSAPSSFRKRLKSFLLSQIL